MYHTLSVTVVYPPVFCGFISRQYTSVSSMIFMDATLAEAGDINSFKGMVRQVHAHSQDGRRTPCSFVRTYEYPICPPYSERKEVQECLMSIIPTIFCPAIMAKNTPNSRYLCSPGVMLQLDRIHPVKQRTAKITTPRQKRP